MMTVHLHRCHVCDQQSPHMCGCYRVTVPFVFFRVGREAANTGGRFFELEWIKFIST